MTAQHHPTVAQVEATEAHALVLSDQALLLDVREHHEWHAGHAPMALHVPLGELTVRHEVLPSDRAIVVVCRSGQRSQLAAQALVAAGYDAANLAGGMQRWVASGLPVEAAGGGPGVVA